MIRSPRGFTMIELMIVVVIIGILAAIAIPNFGSMRNRAREASTKSNMHTFQLAAEDFNVRNDGVYATNASMVAATLPDAGNGFRNPWDGTPGDGHAWRDRPTYSVTLTTGTTVKGIVAYADSVGQKYVIAGRGTTGPMTLRLMSGR